MKKEIVFEAATGDGGGAESSDNKENTISHNEEANVDRERLCHILEKKSGWLSLVQNPPTVADLDKVFKKGGKQPNFKIAAIEYGGDECNSYNNFWDRLQGAWAIASAENFKKVYGDQIKTLETLAQRVLGDNYPGPLVFTAGMTLVEVSEHFDRITKEVQERTDLDFKKANMLSALLGATKDSQEFNLKKRQLYRDIDAICRENDLGDAAGVFERYINLRDIDGFGNKDKAKGLDILKNELSAQMEIHKLFKIIFDKLLEKGYTSGDLAG